MEGAVQVHDGPRATMCSMPQQPSRSAPPTRVRPDASMSLLNNVMDHSLDGGYAEAAARRGEQGGSGLPRTVRGKLVLAAGLVLAAVVVTIGAAQAQVAAPTLEKERQELIDRIDKKTASVDTTQRQVEGLRTEVDEAQRDALDEHGGHGEDASLTALLTGATEVTGPGVKLVVNDAKDTGQAGSDGPRQESSFADTGRVRDRDLQRVVNGLWESGAEAIAVNGQRLTALSAIRAAGDAILVDNKPLPPPYTVEAVGDGQRLSTKFQDSVDGRYLHALQENYGIRASIAVQDSIKLPAAPGFIVRTASPSPTDRAPAANRTTGKGR
jgi:uncharacterized protein YlxW (UPF0749 family)